MSGEVAYSPLAALALSLQFVAFGWRVNREVSVGDKGDRTWFPLPDWLNIASMLSVVALCLVWPTVVGRFGRASIVTLAMAYTLLAFHPLTMAAHYCLLGGTSRYQRYTTRGLPFPRTTSEEWVLLVVSVLAAIAVGFLAISVTSG